MFSASRGWNECCEVWGEGFPCEFMYGKPYVVRLDEETIEISGPKAKTDPPSSPTPSTTTPPPASAPPPASTPPIQTPASPPGARRTPPSPAGQQSTTNPSTPATGGWSTARSSSGGSGSKPPAAPQQSPREGGGGMGDGAGWVKPSRPSLERETSVKEVVAGMDLNVSFLFRCCLVHNA
jgi:hypothetical protein